jgi:hypothetical protein
MPVKKPQTAKSTGLRYGAVPSEALELEPSRSKKQKGRDSSRPLAFDS